MIGIFTRWYFKYRRNAVCSFIFYVIFAAKCCWNCKDDIWVIWPKTDFLLDKHLSLLPVKCKQGLKNSIWLKNENESPANDFQTRHSLTKYKIYWLTFRCIIHNIFRAIKLIYKRVLYIYIQIVSNGYSIQVSE